MVASDRGALAPAMGGIPLKLVSHCRCAALAAALVLVLPAFTAVTGCGHRVPVQPPAPDGAVPDLPLGPAPDALVLPYPDMGLPDVCKSPISFQTWKDPRGRFRIASANALRISFVAYKGASAHESAAAVNHPGMAGMVVARGRWGNSPADDLAEIRQRLSSWLDDRGLGKLLVRASGVSGTSHDGHPDIKDAIWELQLDTATEPTHMRRSLLALALGCEESALTGLPGGLVAYQRQKLLVKLALVHRGSSALITAAVATRADHDHPASVLRVIYDNFANGTAVAAAGAATTTECQVAKAAATPKVDIIWVVDESGSMSDNRKDIVNNATKFFAQAVAAGLDFRMGVAGMKNPSHSSVEPGKFCGEISSAKYSDGGEDRFIGPKEPDVFASCVENPPWYEGGSEFGLTHGHGAVKRHLPRAVGNASKIRKGAKLALIFVTDEAPQGLKKGSELLGHPGFLTGADVSASKCTLSTPDAASLSTALKPLVQLFSGASDPEARAIVHVIGGTCNNTCSAEVAHGYADLAHATGGQVGDVCQSDLSATIKVMLDSVAGAASAVKLQYVPISSTLAVSVRGKRIHASTQKGFLYNAGANSLTFVNVALAEGDQVIASYSRFK